MKSGSCSDNAKFFQYAQAMYDIFCYILIKTIFLIFFFAYKE
jgi:hypothetical protein